MLKYSFIPLHPFDILPQMEQAALRGSVLLTTEGNQVVKWFLHSPTPQPLSLGPLPQDPGHPGSWPPLPVQLLWRPLSWEDGSMTSLQVTCPAWVLDPPLVL